MPGHNFYKQAITSSGTLFQVKREEAVSHSVKGLKNRAEDKRNFVMLAIGEDVHAGDVLVSTVTGDELFVSEVKKRDIRGQLAGLDAFYLTPQEKMENERSPAIKEVAPQTFHIGTNYGMVGHVQHSSQSFTFDRAAIDQEIDRLGQDVEQLHELVKNVAEMQDKPSIARGALECSLTLLQNNPWIVEKVLPSILAFLTNRT